MVDQNPWITMTKPPQLPTQLLAKFFTLPTVMCCLGPLMARVNVLPVHLKSGPYFDGMWVACVASLLSVRADLTEKPAACMQSEHTPTDTAADGPGPQSRTLDLSLCELPPCGATAQCAWHHCPVIVVR